MVNMIKAAKLYRDEYKLSIIPVTSFKTPFKDFDVMLYRSRYPTNDEIDSWWGEQFKTAGLACICGKLSNRTVLDLDSYKNAKTEEFINSLVPDNFVTPICGTPRGGKHWHFQYDSRFANTQIDNEDCSIDIKTEGGMAILPPTIGNNGANYKWVVHPKDVEVSFIPGPLAEYILSIYYKEGGGVGGGDRDKVTNKPIITDINNINDISDIPEGQRDHVLFHIANLLIKGGATDEEVQRYLILMATKCCSPPFPKKVAEAKAKSALKYRRRRDRNIAAEVREWVLVTPGDFFVTLLQHEVTLVTSEEKVAARTALVRLCEEGVIERVGDKRGHYRLIEKDADKIDYQKAILELESKNFRGLNIKFPFGIEQYVWVYPKSIIVIAGSKGSGKTAFCLNLVQLNQQRHKISYFNSEMGEDEFASRLMASDNPDWNFTPYTRNHNFQDVIDSNGFNIVDFLEKEKDFYSIGGDIKKIWDKLDQGLAVICIQKESRAIRGRGGDFSREKARLYLTLDYDSDNAESTIKILDAKNWRDPKVNPRGKYLKYKLIGGINYKNFGAWEEDYE